MQIFNYCFLCIFILICIFQESKGANKPNCEMPGIFKKMGVDCMNSGAKGKEDVLKCVWKKLGLIDENNNFLMVKAFVVGSDLVVNKEGGKEEIIQGILDCNNEFQQGQGEKAVECAMGVFKGVCG